MADPHREQREGHEAAALLLSDGEHDEGRAAAHGATTWRRPGPGALAALVLAVTLLAGAATWAAAARRTAPSALAADQLHVQEEWSWPLAPPTPPAVPPLPSVPPLPTPPTMAPAPGIVTASDDDDDDHHKEPMAAAAAAAAIQDNLDEEPSGSGGHGDGEHHGSGSGDGHKKHLAAHHKATKTTTATETTSTTTKTETTSTETTTTRTFTTTTVTTTTITTTTVTTTTSTTTTTPRRYVSLFCFTVMSTTNYEVDLVRMQVEKGIGIVACEEYMVFSDVKVWLSNGPTFMSRGPKVLVETEVVPINVSGLSEVSSASLEAAWLNAEDFIQVWDRVYRDGRFRHHDWTIKVDPDSVFLPARLRAYLGTDTDIPRNGTVYLRNCGDDHLKCFLQLNLSRTYGDNWATADFAGTSIDTFHVDGCDAKHGDGPSCISNGWGDGVNVIKNQHGLPVAYGNCCKEGNTVANIIKRCVQQPHVRDGVKQSRMNGALEVVSRNAVELYGQQKHKCIRAKKVGVDWSGWGEDYYMQWCLDFLGSEQLEVPELLRDGYCSATPGPCSGPAAVFHPFKDVADMLSCVAETMQETDVPEMHAGLLRVRP